MAQKQGSKISDGGRLDGSNATAVTDADFALGAGWGTAPVLVVAEGSTDQRGRITITCDATAAQATATVTLTFVDGAYASAPFAIVNLTEANAIDDAQPVDVTTTTTTLAWTSGVLPVDTVDYVFTYVVIA